MSRATKIKIICTINPKILSLVYTNALADYCSNYLLTYFRIPSYQLYFNIYYHQTLISYIRLFLSFDRSGIWIQRYDVSLQYHSLFGCFFYCRSNWNIFYISGGRSMYGIVAIYCGCNSRYLEIIQWYNTETINETVLDELVAFASNYQ